MDTIENVMKYVGSTHNTQQLVEIFTHVFPEEHWNPRKLQELAHQVNIQIKLEQKKKQFNRGCASNNLLQTVTNEKHIDNMITR